jgi:hypothetical protein
MLRGNPNVNGRRRQAPGKRDMNASILSRLLGAGALVSVASAGDARAVITSCSNETGFFDVNDCRDQSSGELVGQLVGVSSSPADLFLSFGVGKAAGLAPFAIQRAQADIRDANGSLLEDCHPVTTDRQGALIFGFGIAGAACDTAVSQRITVVYDNEVRL